MYEIAAVRTELSEDGSHAHIEQVGYVSPHTPTDQIFVTIPRILQHIAYGETFGVRIGDELATVTAGKCPACGFEPYLKTAKDTADSQILPTLPRK